MMQKAKMNKEIPICLMTREMVPSTAALEKACFSDPWSEAAFLEELDNPQAVTLVVWTGSEVAGFVNARSLLGEVYINNVAVAEGFRRQGLGKRLLHELEEAVRPFDFITLEVRKSNLPAQRLYEKMQYEIVGERKNFYTSPTENALLMTKSSVDAWVL